MSRRQMAQTDSVAVILSTLLWKYMKSSADFSNVFFLSQFDKMYTFCDVLRRELPFSMFLMCSISALIYFNNAFINIIVC